MKLYHTKTGMKWREISCNFISAEEVLTSQKKPVEYILLCVSNWEKSLKSNLISDAIILQSTLHMT